jgi:hypothetical protein
MDERDTSSVALGKFRSSLDKSAEDRQAFRDGFDMSHWNSRTTTVFNVLDKKLEARVSPHNHLGLRCDECDRFSDGCVLLQDSVSFGELSSGFNRRVAASCFLEVLQLKTWGVLEVAQSKPLGDIHIGFPISSTA